MSEMYLMSKEQLEKEGYLGNPSASNLRLSNHRAYALQNGDVFIFAEKYIQYDQNMFYEVIEIEGDEFASSYWEHTGVVYTMDQLNEYVKEKLKEEY